MKDHTQEVLKFRRDLRVIAELVPSKGRILDLGCGNGDFLKMLRLSKNADVLGIEIDQEAIAGCIANGVPVVQGDLNGSLEVFDDQSFDLVILSQTLQQVRHPDQLLREIVRIGRRAAVSFINFGYWRCRTQLLTAGRMPRTRQIPYEWYDTPNIHFGTICDFRLLCRELKIRILQETPVSRTRHRLAGLWPNLFASGCVFLLEKESLS